MPAKILADAAAFRLRYCLQASGVWIHLLPEVGEKQQVIPRYDRGGSLCQFLFQFMRDHGIEFRHWRVGGDKLRLAHCAAHARVEDFPGLITATAGIYVSHKIPSPRT